MVVEAPPPPAAAKPHKAPVRAIKKVETAAAAVKAPVAKPPPTPAVKPPPAPTRRGVPPPPPAPAPVIVVAPPPPEPELELETVLTELQQVHNAQLETRPLALNGKPLATLLRTKVESTLRQNLLFNEMLLLVAEVDGGDDTNFDVEAHVKRYHRRAVAPPSAQVQSVLADLIAHDVGEFVMAAAAPVHIRHGGAIHLSDYFRAHRQLLDPGGGGGAFTPTQQLQCQSLDELEVVWNKSAKLNEPKRKRGADEAAAEKLLKKRKRDAVLREVANVYSGAFVNDLVQQDHMNANKVWGLAGLDDATAAAFAEIRYNLKVTNDIRYRALAVRNP
jgi:hypothetical protein